MKKHKIIPLNIFLFYLCFFLMGEEGGNIFFFKKVSDLRKKTLLCDHKVRLYHHLDLYNSSTYVIFFFLKMVKNHLFNL